MPTKMMMAAVEAVKLAAETTEAAEVAEATEVAEAPEVAEVAEVAEGGGAAETTGIATAMSFPRALHLRLLLPLPLKQGVPSVLEGAGVSQRLIPRSKPRQHGVRKFCVLNWPRKTQRFVSFNSLSCSMGELQ